MVKKLLKNFFLDSHGVIHLEQKALDELNAVELEIVSGGIGPINNDCKNIADCLGSINKGCTNEITCTTDHEGNI